MRYNNSAKYTGYATEEGLLFKHTTMIILLVYKSKALGGTIIITMLSLIVLLAVFSFSHTVLCQSQSQCILLALPSPQEYSLEISDIDIEFDVDSPPGNKSIAVVATNSELQFSTLLQYIAAISTTPREQANVWSETHCSKMMGVVGDVDFVTAKIIHTLARRVNSNVTIVSSVTPTTYQPLMNLDFLNVLDMNPLVHYIQTLISFTAELNWTRIGLISDGSIYYQYAADQLKQLVHSSGRAFIPYVRLDKGIEFRQALETVQAYGTQIVILSMNRQAACSLLEEAREMDLIWPSYGWLFLDSESGVSLGDNCSHEGVITIKDHSIKSSDMNFESDSSILFDSVLAVTLASEGMQISNAYFEGRTGLVQFRNGNRLNNISAVQVINGSEIEIARYNANTQRLIVTYDVLESDSPRGSVLIIQNENTIGHNILFAIITFLCYLFITVVLILYVLFRNEPEIKATSVTISLSMFVGCYLLLSFILVLLVKAYPDMRVAVPHSATCHFVAWLGGTGIPFPLILATILVKMLRVYAIVNKPLSYKKKFFTDSALLFYIFSLISPNIFFLLLWSSLDPLALVEFSVPVQRGNVVVEFCLSTHNTIWFVITYIYTAILMVTILIVGIKTLPLRYKYLQDTNCTNIFAVVAIASAIMGTIYGYLFAILQPSSVNYTSSEITLSISIITIAMSCQLLLFVPKVLIPLKKFFTQDRVKKKPLTGIAITVTLL